MSPNEEYAELVTTLKDLMAKASKYLIIVGVGSAECINELDYSFEEIFGDAWQRRLRFWGGRSRISLHICTPDELPDVLNEVEEICEKRDRNKRRSVAIVASKAVTELGLNVGNQVRSLAILGPKQSNESSHSLKVLETSSFCDIPVAEWQNRQPAGYDLLPGPGVVVQVNRSTNSLMQQRQFEDEDLNRMRRHIEKMEAEAQGGRGSWKRWRGSTAAILGVLTGAAVMVGQVSAEVSGFSFSFGSLSLSGWGMSLKATLVAAGLGFAAGAAVALLVYVIPWDAFFKGLANILTSVWSWLCYMFSRLQDAVKSFCMGAEAARQERRRGRTRTRRSRSRTCA